jgi:hypothetical protein
VVCTDDVTPVPTQWALHVAVTAAVVLRHRLVPPLGLDRASGRGGDCSSGSSGACPSTIRQAHRLGLVPPHGPVGGLDVVRFVCRYCGAENRGWGTPSAKPCQRRPYTPQHSLTRVVVLFNHAHIPWAQRTAGRVAVAGVVRCQHDPIARGCTARPSPRTHRRQAKGRFVIPTRVGRSGGGRCA